MSCSPFTTSENDNFLAPGSPSEEVSSCPCDILRELRSVAQQIGNGKSLLKNIWSRMFLMFPPLGYGETIDRQAL